MEEENYMLESRFCGNYLIISGTNSLTRVKTSGGKTLSSRISLMKSFSHFRDSSVNGIPCSLDLDLNWYGVIIMGFTV